MTHAPKWILICLLLALGLWGCSASVSDSADEGLVLDAPADTPRAGTQARCSLEVDGEIEFDDDCTYFSGRDGDDDAFETNNYLIQCPDGRSASKVFCPGSAQTFVSGHSGSIYKNFDDSGHARLLWNGGASVRHSVYLDGLIKEGDCWVSSKSRLESAPWATRLVKFCASPIPAMRN